MFRRLSSVMRLSTLVLGGATAVLYGCLAWLTYSMVNDIESLEREQSLRTASGALYASVLKLGLRGYLLTQDPTYSKTHSDGRAELMRQLDVLTRLTVADPLRREKVTALRTLLSERTTPAELWAPRPPLPPAPARAVFAGHLVAAEQSSEALTLLLQDLLEDAGAKEAKRVGQRKEFLWRFWLVFSLTALALGPMTAYLWATTHVLVQQGERTVEESSQAALHDALTGLPNRRLLDLRAEAAFARSDEQLALLMLDLDGFKAVNDNHGHLAGDELLKVVAQRLRKSVRTRDLVVRLGGDEFVVFVENCRDRAEVRELATRLLAGIVEPVDIAGHAVRVGVSIGMCFSGPGTGALTPLLRSADSALYTAKRAGKGQIAECAAQAPHAPD